MAFGESLDAGQLPWPWPSLRSARKGGCRAWSHGMYIILRIYHKQSFSSGRRLGQATSSVVASCVYFVRHAG